MRIHRLSPTDALASVRSSLDGLTTAEARRRLHEYGPNRMEKVARTSLGKRLLRDFAHFFAVVLWISAGLSFLAEWNNPGQGMARVGYAIIVVILVSGVFSFWQEHRVEQVLASLQKLLPHQVKALRDGAMRLEPAEHLVPGDVVHLDQGDIIPADCRLIEASGVRVNTSVLTGESVPHGRDADASKEEDPLQSRNILLAGTSLVAGQARAVIFATGMDTEFGKIAHLSQSGGETVTPLRRELAHLSRLIVLLAVLIGLAFFAAGTMLGMPFWEDTIFSIGIFVAMVPEGLLPTLTLALVLAAQRMARRNVLIRHLPSVEALGSTTVICTDKTGTLTENRMKVRELLLGLQSYPAEDAARPGAADQHGDLFLAAGACHDLSETQSDGGGKLVGDPMEIALVEMARQAMPDFSPGRRIGDIPFDTKRMRQSVVLETRQGAVLYCKGALEAVLPLCGRICTNGDCRPLDCETRNAVLKKQDEMAEKGLRVLAFASRLLPPPAEMKTAEEDLIFRGLVGLEDPPRPEVAESLKRCREAGIKVIMVTGDHPRTATAIARRIGMIRSEAPTVLTGEHLRKLSLTQLQLALDAPEIVFARIAPEQKMRIVKALKKKGHIVAVTGDGVNDAPALKDAHIGVAMGVAGTDVAKEAADMVLLDDNFASIVSAVEEGRAVFRNIRKFLTYVLVHNVAELVPYLAFALFRIPLPLTPIQILAVDMGTDTLTALGLGVERPGPRAMLVPPRPRRERLLNAPLALRAYLFLGLIEAAAAMAAFFHILHAGGWTYGQMLAPDDPLYRRATSSCLSAIIVMQIVNVFLCRSPRRSVLSTGVRGNPLILWGVALEIGLAIVFCYTAWGNAILGTAPVPAELWLFLMPFAAAMLLMEELRKWLARRRWRDRP